MTAAVVPGPLEATAAVSGTHDITLLVEREAPALLAYFARRVAVTEDAADLLGDLYVVVWRRRSAIPGEPVAARMWLYGAARKVLARHRRSTGRRVALSARLREQLATHPEVVAPHDGPGAAVRELIASLDPLDREIITLAYWEGFSFVEIAAILRMPAATVRSRHARAKARLRDSLAAEGLADPT